MVDDDRSAQTGKRHKGEEDRVAGPGFVSLMHLTSI